MTTPTPAPAGPTTIPDPVCASCGIMVHVEYGMDFDEGDMCWDCLYKATAKLEAELARERRRCEALVKAGNIIDNQLDIEGCCRCDKDGYDYTCQKCLARKIWDAAKALQGQDGAGGTN
jgi:hypothetical protein